MLNLTDFIEYVRVPILVFDRSLTLIAYNTDAESLLPEISSNLAAEVIFNSKKVANEILNCLNNGQVTDPEINFNSMNGGNLCLKMTRFESDGSGVVIITLSDLTPLTDAKAMTRDFVANVSHEIRSPLTIVNGFIETLLGSAGDDISSRSKFLKIMLKETERMQILVSDLLSLSLAEVKQKQRITGLLDIRVIAKEAVEVSKKSASKRKKNLLLRVAKSVPIITGDNENIRQVLINLIENSINYSNPNTIIRIDIDNLEACSDFPKPNIRIRIKDKSDGIPESQLHRLTERFYRVDKSRSRNVGGTGLGLAIVKHILLRHGGDLVINSTVGKGSTFDVFLPID